LQKKADLQISTLIELIVFVVILLLIIIPISAKVWNYFIEKPDSGTIKSFEALIIESNNLDSQRELPVYVDKNHIITAYPKGRGVSEKCGVEFSCLCICGSEGCTIQEVNQCERVEVPFAGQYTIHPAKTETAEQLFKTAS